MNQTHPFSRYGEALLMSKENIKSINEITPQMLMKYLENGLNHFRIQTDNNPEVDDYLDFTYITMQTIIANNVKGNPSKGIYLAANIITNDLKANNVWIAVTSLYNKLKQLQQLDGVSETITMGLMPIAGELNNGKKTKTNTKGTLLEAACCAISNTTPLKPYLAFRKKTDKGQSYIPTTIIPDIELKDMITFIQFYDLMLNTTINQKKLLQRKIYKNAVEKPKFSRPPIYDGNFPFAPKNSAFGVVGLLGAIGRWAKEAGYSERGKEVLDRLKDKPLYLIQYGKARSVTINHYIIDLAKENKLSDIVFAIQNSWLIYPFDENKPEHKKGIESRKEVFNLFSSRFLELFNKPTFKDFLSVRSEYKTILIELFNTFFMNQMQIRKEVVLSVRELGLWLNKVAYLYGQREAKKEKKPDKVKDYKAKCLMQLESTVFSARKPAEILNVIVIAGRHTGLSAPANSDTFQQAVLTGEISMDDAKSMLMAYARTRNHYETKDDVTTNTDSPKNEEDGDPDATE